MCHGESFGTARARVMVSLPTGGQACRIHHGHGPPQDRLCRTMRAAVLGALRPIRDTQGRPEEFEGRQASTSAKATADRQDDTGEFFRGSLIQSNPVYR